MDTLIPAFLRRQRNQRRLTLEMLSAKVGMSPQHLSEIESGKRDPRLSSIPRNNLAPTPLMRAQAPRTSAGPAHKP